MTNLFEAKQQFLAFSVPVQEAPFSFNGTLQIPANYICVVVNPDGTTSEIYNPMSKNYTPLHMSLFERKFYKSRIFFMKPEQFTLHFPVTVNDTSLQLDVLCAIDVFNAHKIIQVMGNNETLTIGNLAYLTKNRINSILQASTGNIYATDKRRHATICDCLTYSGLKVFRSSVTKVA